MSDHIFNPSLWHWVALACVFYGLEIVAPGVFFLWLGFAATASGIVKAIFPDVGWQVQYILFAVFCVVSLFCWHFYARNRGQTETDQPQLNQRNRRYLGRVLVLTEAIENGYGKVRVEDSTWKVTGNDAAVGTRVKVVEVDGSIFHVEAVQN